MPDVVTWLFTGLAPSGVAEYTGMPAKVVSSTRSPPREIEASPVFTVKITSMAEKDLSGWNTNIKNQTGDIPNGFTIAPAYNKGAYQVVPSTDTDAYTHRK